MISLCLKCLYPTSSHILQTDLGHHGLVQQVVLNQYRLRKSLKATISKMKLYVSSGCHMQKHKNVAFVDQFARFRSVLEYLGVRYVAAQLLQEIGHIEDPTQKIFFITVHGSKVL